MTWRLVAYKATLCYMDLMNTTTIIIMEVGQSMLLHHIPYYD